MIEAGADVNAWGFFGDDITALMLAAYRNSVDTARLLIESGADISVAVKFRLRYNRCSGIMYQELQE